MVEIDILVKILPTAYPNGHSNIVIFYFEIFASQKYKTTMVELELLIRPFSPGSTLEPGLEVFHRRGPK
jgi:hypothetical protein